VRSLSRERVPVVGFFYTREHFGRFSRLIQAHFLDRTLPTERIASILTAYCSGLPEKPVLMAASDEFAFILARHREQLAEHFAFHWVSSETAFKVFDKAEMSRLCEQAGILCPKTHVTVTGEDIGRAASAFLFPCIVKPVRSFHTAFPFRKKTFVAGSPAALLRFYERHPGLVGHTLWQEFIEGPDDEIVQSNVLIGESGETRAVCGVKKLRQYPPGRGNMCFGRTEDNAIAASQGLKLLHFLRYSGLASLEFKRQPNENRYYFIEMNARLPWYCALFAQAGVNLPYLAYMDLSGAEGECLSRTQQAGVHWMIARDDLGSILECPRDQPGGFLQWMRSLVRTQSFAWWNLRDPAPFLFSTLSWVGAAFSEGTDREAFNSVPSGSPIFLRSRGR
jgi:D-aspartate ligase